MATIQGQLPSRYQNAPTRPADCTRIMIEIFNMAGTIDAEFAAGGVPLGGTTAQRPVAPALYLNYFDTTIGQPVWCSSITPVTWVNAAGVTV
jgi:hypothetical protein